MQKDEFQLNLDQMFEKSIDIWVNSIMIMAITPAPEFEETIHINHDLMAMEGITVTVSDPNADYIRDRLMGRVMETGDSETDDASSREMFIAARPFSDIVELWDLNGEVWFTKAEDALTTFNVCERFLTALSRKQKYSLNFRGGDEVTDDIRKLEAIVADLKFYAAFIEREGAVSNDSVSSLFGMMRRTSSHNRRERMAKASDNAIVVTKAGIAEMRNQDQPSPFGGMNVN